MWWTRAGEDERRNSSAGAAGTVGRARQVIEINLVLIGPGNVAMQLAHALVRERFADSATALRK
jgi:hypothetical protein